jgi:hypothetical protein
MPKLEVGIEAVQEGSGDPSPENIRPISGWDEVNVTVADDTTDPTTENVYTLDLDGTRYGGKVDLVSGVMTVDRLIQNLGQLNWDKDSQNRWFGVASPSVVLPNLKPISSNDDVANLLCSQYKATSRNLITSVEGICQNVGGSILINDAYALANYDNSQFKTYINGVQLVYELATPLTIQLTPTVVKSLSGVNNISADSGDVIDGKYFSKGE